MNNRLQVTWHFIDLLVIVQVLSSCLAELSVVVRAGDVSHGVKCCRRTGGNIKLR